MTSAMSIQQKQLTNHEMELYYFYLLLSLQHCFTKQYYYYDVVGE